MLGYVFDLDAIGWNILSISFSYVWPLVGAFSSAAVVALLKRWFWR